MYNIRYSESAAVHFIISHLTVVLDVRYPLHFRRFLINFVIVHSIFRNSLSLFSLDIRIIIVLLHIIILTSYPHHYCYFFISLFFTLSLNFHMTLSSHRFALLHIIIIIPSWYHHGTFSLFFNSLKKRYKSFSNMQLRLSFSIFFVVFCINNRIVFIRSIILCLFYWRSFLSWLFILLIFLMTLHLLSFL